MKAVNNDICLKEGTILVGKNHQYRIRRAIGNGTFGITYLADIYDLQGNKTGESAALKEFFMSAINSRVGNDVEVGGNPETFRDYYRRFRREASTMSKIHTDNVVSVIDYFDANRTSYYAMKYIEGGSVDDKIKSETRLGEREALRITAITAKALQSLHDRKILHLDIKPSNIMMDGSTPMLIDFGLAKIFASDSRGEDSSFMGMGTPGYAPIEQGTVDLNRTIPYTIDIYSLCATLFKMLTGQCPPSAGTILASGLPEDELEEVGASPATIRIISRGMQPLADRRYNSMAELAADLEYVMGCIDSGAPDLYLPSEQPKQAPVAVNVWNDVNPEDGFVTVDGVRRTSSGSFVVNQPPMLQPLVQGVAQQPPMRKRRKDNTIRNIIVGGVCFILAGGICGTLFNSGVFSRTTTIQTDDFDDEDESDVVLSKDYSSKPAAKTGLRNDSTPKWSNNVKNVKTNIPQQTNAKKK